jgi:hypothetical protein
MATGIVSIGIDQHGLHAVSAVLMWLGVAAFLAIAVRAVRFRAGLRDPQRAFGFFTVVAGINVLGARFALGGQHTTALVLLGLGGLGWFVLGTPCRGPRCSGATGGRCTPGRTARGGISVIFWCFGTWLIPVLIAAGWWRHVVHRVAFAGWILAFGALLVSRGWPASSRLLGRRSR